MGLPTSVDNTTPPGGDPVSQGDDQIRALKLFLTDLFGIPNATSIASAPTGINSSGLLTALRMANSTWLTGRNAAGNADLNLIRIGPGDLLEFGQSQPSVSLGVLTALSLGFPTMP